MMNSEGVISMLMNLIQKIRNIRLIWKLLIPFLFLSFFGNTIMAFIGLNSQQNMIKKEERNEIHNFYHLFLANMDYKKKQASALATVIAENPHVQELLSNHDRQGLSAHMSPVFQKLKKEFEITQFHFHDTQGRSFLRLHLPEKYGDSIAYRKTIESAIKTGNNVAGLERGLSGLGIRGIAPVFHRGELVGTVEIGYPFGGEFLENLKLEWGPDFTVYEKKGENAYHCLATTLKYCKELYLIRKDSDLDEEPTILIAPDDFPDKSFTFGPIKDYAGNTAALVKIEKDRSKITRKLRQTRNLMIFFGLVGILVSSGIVWLVAAQFTKPIGEIVQVAQEIAEEKREIHLNPKSDNEIGMLTRSLNSMLESLKQRRMQIEEYARTLEKRVEERTADLLSSEERYRKLVEHLPLIVYRLLDDGTVELVNPYFTQTLGYSVEEAVSNKNFWLEKIYGQTENGDKNLLASFFGDGKEVRAERIVRDKKGNVLTFIDHMIPMTDGFGNAKWLDGIMVDITELKNLQEKALQTEEVRVLGEISARFAHEIRNPLVIAGGFARRLYNSLPEEDKSRKLAKIILEEVSRLEQILRIMLSSIEPFTLCISEIDLNRLLRSLLDELGDMVEQKQLYLHTSFRPNLPKIQIDEGLLHRAVESLLKHAVQSMPRRKDLMITTDSENDHLILTIKYYEEGLSEKDLEQFFFPRITGKNDASNVELPLSRVIINRHGGKIELNASENHLVVMRVALPVEQEKG